MWLGLQNFRFDLGEKLWKITKKTKKQGKVDTAGLLTRAKITGSTISIPAATTGVATPYNMCASERKLS